MNRFFRLSFLSLALSGVLLLSSCSDDPALPDNLANFESDAQGLGASESELNINITLVRAADADGTIVVAYNPSSVVYGTDFTTEPAAVNNTITIPITAGATSASFKVKKAHDLGWTAADKIDFTIQSAEDGILLGEKKTFALTFAAIVATTGTMELNGGGTSFPNQVYVDFSANRQVAVARTSWDLAFVSTGDQFRVLLNSSNGMLVRAIDKTDLAAVKASDTVGFGGQLGIGAIFSAASSNTPPDWLGQATSWIDDPKGDITKSAINVSATDADNKVFIVNRGTGVGTTQLGWKKIRVVRNGANYKLQVADIGSTSIATVDVPKSSTSAFTYVSLTSNSVYDGVPPTSSWDIAWMGFTNTTPLSATVSIPYYFQDIVVQNITGGVSTVSVTPTATLTYDTFAESDLANLTLVGNNQLNIGSSWRSTGGPGGGSTPTVTNRFYIVKDGDGNVYKVQFTGIVIPERGRPTLKFALVKKGA